MTDVEIERLLEVNRAFYTAFEANEIDAMSAVWEHSDRVACTHPGWATQHGWGRVVASWFALFNGPQQLQFILTDERATIVGDCGWVVLEENLLDGAASGTVTALNLFTKEDGEWKMVAHHGSAVVIAPGLGE